MTLSDLWLSKLSVVCGVLMYFFVVAYADKIKHWLISGGAITVVLASLKLFGVADITVVHFAKATMKFGFGIVTDEFFCDKQPNIFLFLLLWFSTNMLFALTCICIYKIVSIGINDTYNKNITGMFFKKSIALYIVLLLVVSLIFTVIGYIDDTVQQNKQVGVWSFLYSVILALFGLISISGTYVSDWSSRVKNQVGFNITAVWFIIAITIVMILWYTFVKRKNYQAMCVVKRIVTILLICTYTICFVGIILG